MASVSDVARANALMNGLYSGGDRVLYSMGPGGNESLGSWPIVVGGQRPWAETITPASGVLSAIARAEEAFQKAPPEVRALDEFRCYHLLVTQDPLVQALLQQAASVNVAAHGQLFGRTTPPER